MNHTGTFACFYVLPSTNHIKWGYKFIDIFGQKVEYYTTRNCCTYFLKRHSTELTKNLTLAVNFQCQELYCTNYFQSVFVSLRSWKLVITWYQMELQSFWHFQFRMSPIYLQLKVSKICFQLSRKIVIWWREQRLIVYISPCLGLIYYAWKIGALNGQ